MSLIDLKLPSRSLWNDRNIGAKSPTDIGHYLCWGDYKPKDSYDYNYDDSINFNDYSYLDNPDDQEYLNFHIPYTHAWNELFACCKYKFDSSINAYVFTKNKKDLIFPVSGYKINTLIANPDCGFYWAGDSLLDKQISHNVILKQSPIITRRCNFIGCPIRLITY